MNNGNRFGAFAAVTVKLSGKADTPFTAFYIQNGHRVDVSAALPWTLHGTGITKFELRKINPNEAIGFVAHYKKAGGTRVEQSRVLQ